MNLSFNPNITTNAQNTFNIETTGYIVGTLQDDPVSRYQIAGGPLASTETLPMWGGLPIFANIPPTTPGSANSLGTPVGRALSMATMVGFSIFNQDHAMINSPQSSVPMASNGMLVNYVKFGSLARVSLPVNPTLASLVASSIITSVSWDFVNNWVTTYQAAYAANVLTASVWSSPNGGTLTFTTTSAHGVAVGSSFTISGSTPSGFNGTYIAATGTTGSTLVAIGTGATPGTISVEGTLVAGGGAIGGLAYPARVLDINIGNSMTVNYNATTGFAGWNYQGNTILLQI